MLSQNNNKRQKCGLTRWHSSGYTGQGITVAVLDEPSAVLTHMDKDIYSAPLGAPSEIGHGTHVAQVVHEAAPSAKIILLPFMNDPDRAQTLMWLKVNKPDIINMSLALTSADWCWPELMSLGVLVIAAGGNHGLDTQDLSKPACYDWTIGVGGIYENGNLYIDNNSGDSMDCVAYTGVYTQNSKGNATPFGGTSCASPWLAGMLATYYSNQTVPPVEAVRQMIKNNCVDLNTPGHDRYSGSGFFNMPPVGEQPQVDYESEEDTMKIVMKLGDPVVEIDGMPKVLDCAPFAQDGRTFVPLRFIAETLGCQVDYNSGAITITKE